MRTPAHFVPREVEVDGWRIRELSDGFFRLDGGAMWGVVPANLWRKLTPPAEDNTIRMALRPFLAEKGSLKVVIEGGVGQRWEEKWQRIYHLEPTPTLAESLAACGVAPHQVTHAIASHCHWDHIGAWVRNAANGALEPLFPRARHFAPRVEIARAKDPGHARAGSYRADDIVTIEAAGLLEAFDGEREIVPGIVCHTLGGHSDGVGVITVGDIAKRPAIFWSDVVPTTHHAQPAYIMAYDVDVARSFEVRSEWIARAANGGWTGLFYHDESIPFGRMVRDGRRFAVEPVGAELKPLAEPGR